jgi:hypothetical protein
MEDPENGLHIGSMRKIWIASDTGQEVEIRTVNWLKRFL